MDETVDEKEGRRDYQWKLAGDRFYNEANTANSNKRRGNEVFPSRAINEFVSLSFPFFFSFLLCLDDRYDLD